MPDDRGRGRPFSPQRPRPGGAPFSPRPGGAPFSPRPTGGGESFTPRPAPVTARTIPDQLHTVRLRDGDREIEVSGSAGFVRQLLDDLPALLGRLRQQPGSRPSSISMPPPPPPLPPVEAAPAPAAEVSVVAAPESPPEPVASGNGAPDALTRKVLSIMRKNARPMGIAEIRQRLPEDISGQQVRRVLERASEQVVNAGGRPAEYRLR